MTTGPAMRGARAHALVPLLCLLLCPIGWCKRTGDTYLELIRRMADTASLAQFPDAEAVVVYDSGASVVSIEGQDGWESSHTRRRIIKIFSSEGYQYASVKIRVPRGMKATDFRATTYTSQNGQMSAAAVPRSAMLEEETARDILTICIAFEKTGVGSVIDLSYTLWGKGVAVHPWWFQSGIPTLRSVYSAEIPDLVVFNREGRGTVPFAETRSERRGKLLTFTAAERPFPYTALFDRYVAENVPALKDDEFVGTASDYALSTRYQLVGYNLPLRAYVDLGGTWKKVEEMLLRDSDFGPRMETKRALLSPIADRVKACGSTRQRAEMVRRFVCDQIRLKGDDLFAEHSPRECIKQGKGTSAEINLLLVSLLRAADIKADPVILSTRENGIPSVTSVMRDQYNCVTALAEIDGAGVFVDATDRFVPVGMLPVRCLNSLGRAISAAPRTVALSPQAVSALSYRAELSPTPENALAGSCTIERTGYFAVEPRRVLTEKSSAEYLDRLHRENPDWEVTEHACRGKDSLLQPLVETLSVNIRNAVQIQGAQMLLMPGACTGMADHPFVKETRELPVDLCYPRSRACEIRLLVSTGYRVDKVPPNAHLALPDGDADLQYRAVRGANDVTITCALTFKRTLFVPEAYSGLREFWNRVVAKVREPIVLVKI